MIADAVTLPEAQTRRLLRSVPVAHLAAVALIAALASCGGPSAPSLTGAVVQGTTSAQVRQGEGEVIVVLSGANLAGASAVTFGDLAASVQSSTSSSLVAVVQVPHGATIGPRPAQVTTSTGSGSRAAALIVSAITSAPAGNDGTGRGTPDRPFRSLTRAVQVAQPGDTVALRDGRYAEGVGIEIFPVVVSGLVIQGESRDGTVIDGSTSVDSDGLFANTGTTVLRDFTVRDFGREGVEIQGGTVSIERLWVHGSGDDNLDIERDSTMVTVVDSVFTDAGDTNIEIGGDRIVPLNVSISGSVITGSGGHGITVRSVATVVIKDSTIADSGNDNVHLRLGGSVSISGSTVTGAAGDGIDAESYGTVKVRSSVITGNGADGIDIGTSGTTGHTQSAVDLGTEADPGGNEIKSNAVYQLSDSRAGGSGVVIHAVGNDLGAPVSGLKTGPAGDGSVWDIAQAGNQIDFGP